MASTYTLKWTIDNYSKLNLKKNECIKSPVFEIDQGKQKWNLELYPNGDAADPDDVSCFLRKTAGIGNISVKYTLYLMCAENSIFMSKKGPSTTFEENTSWGDYLTKIVSLENEMKKLSTDVLIVKCIMDIQNSNTDSYNGGEAKSKIGLNQVTLAWCVKKPGSLEWTQKKVVNCTETALKVILTTAEDDVLIEIKNISKIKIRHQRITSKISVIDANNFERLSAKDTFNFDSTSNDSLWKYPNFISKKSLEEKNCIVNGFFTLILEFSVPNGIITKEIKDSVEYDVDPMVKTKLNVDAITFLQYDFNKLLSDKKHSDVNLKADEKLIPAHKCLLSSRSPVFRAMFDCEILENQINVVEINDLDFATLENFLKFLYAGTIDTNDSENTLKLMLAADKYQVESLLEKSAEILMNLMSRENVCDVIVIADIVKHEDLKASALHLIEENSEYILSSSDWTEWSKQNVHLALEIASKLALQCSKYKKNKTKITQ